VEYGEYEAGGDRDVSGWEAGRVGMVYLLLNES